MDLLCSCSGLALIAASGQGTSAKRWRNKATPSGKERRVWLRLGCLRSRGRKARVRRSATVARKSMALATFAARNTLWCQDSCIVTLVVLGMDASWPALSGHCIKDSASCYVTAAKTNHKNFCEKCHVVNDFLVKSVWLCAVCFRNQRLAQHHKYCTGPHATSSIASIYC